MPGSNQLEVNSTQSEQRFASQSGKETGADPRSDRFCGWCATGLLVTDPGAAPVRTTIDVDAIVELTANVGLVMTEELLEDSTIQRRGAAAPVRTSQDVDAITSAASYVELIKIENRLREIGFRECCEDGAPRCCWISGDLTLDLMPTDPAILGFTNRWYRPALVKAAWVQLAEYRIRVVTASYFLATKLEAFHGRGKDDYATSHDLEDIVTVLDGRPELAQEIAGEPQELRQYLSTEFQSMLSRSEFRDALPGHLLPDAASQQRISIVIDRIQRIIDAA